MPRAARKGTELRVTMLTCRGSLTGGALAPLPVLLLPAIILFRPAARRRWLLRRAGRKQQARDHQAEPDGGLPARDRNWRRRFHVTIPISGHGHRSFANRRRDRSLAFTASTSRSREGALVCSEVSSRRAASPTSVTARSNASALACEGWLKPESLRTNCSAEASISASVTGGSKLNNVLMLRHMLAPWLAGSCGGAVEFAPLWVIDDHGAAVGSVFGTMSGSRSSSSGNVSASMSSTSPSHIARAK